MLHFQKLAAHSEVEISELKSQTIALELQQTSISHEQVTPSIIQE